MVLYSFQVYNTVIWYMYTLQNNHSKSSESLSPYIVTELKKFSYDEDFKANSFSRS